MGNFTGSLGVAGPVVFTAAGGFVPAPAMATISAEPPSQPPTNVQFSTQQPGTVGIEAMTDAYTKAEIDAKLEVVQAKAETVRVGIEAKLDRVLEAIGDLRAKVHTDLEGVKDDNKATRRVVIVTIVVSVFAAIAAIYAAQANNIAALQVGLEAGAKAAG